MTRTAQTSTRQPGSRQPGSRQPGTRDRSAGVKAAILDSARRLFIARGYDDTGIRDVAAGAGVNPAIVIRHFLSKEALFVEAVNGAEAWRQLIDGPLEQLGERVVDRIVRGRGAGLKIFGLTVQASGHPEVHARLQECMVAFFAEPLIGRIDAPDAELRAHLFAAQVIGLMAALAVYDDQFLLRAPVDDVVTRYGDSLQRTLTGG